jgi:hypothetical protein
MYYLCGGGKMSDTVIVTERQVPVVVRTTAPESILVTSVGGEVSSVKSDESTDAVVTTAAPEVVVIKDLAVGPPGTRGPQGIPGPAGGTVVVYPAGIVLSGHRMVVVEDGVVVYADCLTAAHGNVVLGMTIGAAMLGADATVQTSGVIEEPSWNWTLGVPVWLGENGLLVQVAPVAGFSLIVGFPIADDTLFIDIREPIFLEGD